MLPPALQSIKHPDRADSSCLRHELRLMYLTNQHGLDRGNKGYSYAEHTHIVSCITCTLCAICILSIIIFAYCYSLQSCTLIAMFCKHTLTHARTHTHTHTRKHKHTNTHTHDMQTCIFLLEGFFRYLYNDGFIHLLKIHTCTCSTAPRSMYHTRWFFCSFNQLTISLYTT